MGCSGGAGTAAEAPGPSDSATTVPGMVIYTSNYTAGETVTGLQDQVNAIGKVAATVDFAATGQSIGQQLGPTTVILGGNPKAGTP